MDMTNHQGFSKHIIMNKYLITICILCFTCNSFAQKRKLNKANKLYNNRAYIEAAVLYEELEPTQEILLNLGDCYYYNSEMEQAKKVYNSLLTKYKDSSLHDVYFKYAHALMGKDDYSLADSIMTKYRGKNINSSNFIEKLKSVVPYNYELKDINAGSNSSDFGVSYFGSDIVFASTRNIERPNYVWNNKNYLDLFSASISKDKKLENITPFSESINTKTHESNAYFTKDGKTMYFSRTGEERIEDGEEKYATVKIYKSELVDSVWTNINIMPFSGDTFSTQHPILNPSETKLYFSSDMSGTIGSFDIYYVDITEDGYGDPINLGNEINTIHREQFPFISKDSLLYFSSNGHQGLGGLDIFSSHINDSLYSKPLNLGNTINSGMDDFGFVLNDSIQEGFLSSNRDGIDKIYSFIRKENERTFIVEGVVRDKNSKELLPGTKVTLFQEDGTSLGEMVVDEDGKYLFYTKPNRTYKIEGYRNFYIPTIEEFKTTDEGKIEFNIELEVESYDDAEEIVVTKTDGYIYIELENIYFDLNKYNIKTQAAKTLDILARLLKKYPRMEVQLGAHTDSRNSHAYNLRLSVNRANSTFDYLVSHGINKDRLQSKGFGEGQPLVSCGTNCSEDEHSINRRCEFIILK